METTNTINSNTDRKKDTGYLIKSWRILYSLEQSELNKMKIKNNLIIFFLITIFQIRKSHLEVSSPFSPSSSTTLTSHTSFIELSIISIVIIRMHIHSLKHVRIHHVTRTSLSLSHRPSSS
mmetsp:Transcript_20689/g.20034  ORF Transcript_20689/g.20034 Transcript_20689/m.20034 type:complete len:121 (+) Transcript_20689:88-450(+)